VEFADDQLETATGLMFRESIADDKGMLFDFGEPREANMWMRNVSFPIDMVFTDTDGKVLAVVSHVQPYSERRINPGFPVKSVLELADGKAISLGIKPGDQLIHPMFDSATETAPEVAPETSEDTAASEN
ncbi:MAG: hypothetical protein CMK07_11265, partial [Ponticaulis sp.]|nr:hypothetical protein [Ponticaulis sp.]